MCSSKRKNFHRKKFTGRGFVQLKVIGELDIGDNVRINSCRFCNLADGGVTSFQVLKSGKLTISTASDIKFSYYMC